MGQAEVAGKREGRIGVKKQTNMFLHEVLQGKQQHTLLKIRAGHFLSKGSPPFEGPGPPILECL